MPVCPAARRRKWHPANQVLPERHPAARPHEHTDPSGEGGGRGRRTRLILSVVGGLACGKVSSLYWAGDRGLEHPHSPGEGGGVILSVLGGLACGKVSSLY